VYLLKDMASTSRADILVIDDTPDNLRLLNQILSQEYRVRLSPNATSGLNAALSAHPDLILLDIMLPDLNGFEVAARLKAEPRTADIPIIFISALDDTASKLQAFEAGGVDYVSKPFQEMEVLARVKNCITTRLLFKKAQAEIAVRRRAEEEMRESEARYRLLAENITDVIWVLNITHRRWTYISPSVEQLRGFTPEEALAQSIEESLSPESRGPIMERLAKSVPNFLADPTRAQYHVAEIRQPCKNGQNVWVEISGKYRFNAAGELELVGVSRNIERRKETEHQLQISEERHRLLADNSIDLVFTMSLERKLTYVSPSVEPLFGYAPDAFTQMPFEELFTPESSALFRACLETVEQHIQADTPLDIRSKELQARRAGSGLIWIELTLTGIYTPDGKFVEILGVARDISGRKRYEQELRAAHDALAAANQELQLVNAELSRIATTDALTGLWNRRLIEETLRAEMAEAQRYQQPLSMILFDIDNFKTVNDDLGHKAGDQVLIELAQRLQHNLRAADRLARWGGEEFMVLAPQCGAADGLALAEKLRALIASQPFAAVGKISASFGVAELSPDEDLDGWFKRADQALYQAKHAGRNRVELG